MSNEKLHLDVDLEKARALHQVWRALNDGDCPKCHRFVVEPLRSTAGLWEGKRSATGALKSHMTCPVCGFFITAEEVADMQLMFAPAIDAAVAIFEEWRASRKQTA